MTKILLVEDDKSLREIYGVRLLAEGYDIVSAGDGEEALAMAIKERPTLIISDVMMPKISGFDMLDILRSTTETKDIKVIMMTALSSEDQRSRGEQLGADRYLVKSQVGIEDVVRTVHEVLGDAPVTQQTAPSANQATPRPFAPPAAPAAVAPAPTPAAPQTPTPAVPPVPQPASAPTAPQAPAQPPASAPAPQPLPQPQTAAPAPPAPQPAPPAPQAPAPQAQSASSLPQPTAPFSSPRPANLGERVIQPIASEPTNQPDLSAMIDKELSTPEPPNPFAQADDTASTGSPAPIPAPQAAPSAPQAPAAQPQTPPAEPTAQPSPPPMPQVPAEDSSAEPELSFEETPRSTN